MSQLLPVEEDKSVYAVINVPDHLNSTVSNTTAYSGDLFMSLKYCTYFLGRGKSG